MRGSVVKRGKRYYIVYYIGKDSNNKWVQKWEGGFATVKEAQKTLRKRITEIENSFANKVERCELGTYLRHWLWDYCEDRLARNTINGYRNNIEKHIIPHIGTIPINKLQPADISGLYAALKAAKLSSTSILYVHRTLHKALASAVKARVLSHNVTDYVDPPLRSRFKASVLNAEQSANLIKACKQTEVFIPVTLAIMLGLRRGEVLGLLWSDIDFDLKTVTISRTITFHKGGYTLSDVKTANSNRTLLLSDSVIEILLEHKSCQKQLEAEFGDGFNSQGFVVCRADGTPLSASVMNHQFRKLLESSGLPAIRFHDLRHTNATLMLKNQVPAKIVSAMLGHSSVGITLDTYSHVITEMQQGAVNAIEQLLKDKC